MVPTWVPVTLQGVGLSPDLMEVVNAWEALPKAVRLGVLTMVRAMHEH